MLAAVTLTNMITKRGTTLRFRVHCTIDGAAVDITGDTVVFVAKTDKSLPDASASITAVADVATEGADGIGIVHLTPALTDIEERQYFWDITWTTAAGDEYVRAEGVIDIDERTSDA